MPAHIAEHDEPALEIPYVNAQPSVEKNMEQVKHRRITVVGVLRILIHSSRAMTALTNTLLYGYVDQNLDCGPHCDICTISIIYTSQEPTLSLHLQDVWGLSSSKIGIIYIAAVLPAIACQFLVSVSISRINLIVSAGPLSGWWTDRWGSEWILLACIALTIPWILVTIIERWLALFIVAFALESWSNMSTTHMTVNSSHVLVGFFFSGIISPITAELAAVSRDYDGLGCEQKFS